MGTRCIMGCGTSKVSSCVPKPLSAGSRRKRIIIMFVMHKSQHNRTPPWRGCNECFAYCATSYEGYFFLSPRSPPPLTHNMCHFAFLFRPCFTTFKVLIRSPSPLHHHLLPPPPSLPPPSPPSHPPLPCAWFGVTGEPGAHREPVRGPRRA